MKSWKVLEDDSGVRMLLSSFVLSWVAHVTWEHHGLTCFMCEGHVSWKTQTLFLTPELNCLRFPLRGPPSGSFPKPLNTKPKRASSRKHTPCSKKGVRLFVDSLSNQPASLLRPTCPDLAMKKGPGERRANGISGSNRRSCFCRPCCVLKTPKMTSHVEGNNVGVMQSDFPLTRCLALAHYLQQIEPVDQIFSASISVGMSWPTLCVSRQRCRWHECVCVCVCKCVSVCVGGWVGG